jgi:hypothetical protein
MILHGAMLGLAVVGVLVATVLIIVGLTLLPVRFRRYLIRGTVFVAGLFYALEFFLPTSAVVKPNGTTVHENFLTQKIPDVIAPLADILGALLLGLGLFSLARIHSSNVLKRRPGWGNSLALLIAAVVMLVVGFSAKATEHPAQSMKDTYSVLFDGVYQNMDAAMFSLISFFILSAAYRAFRIRSIESSILMISALIVLAGLSFGVLLTNSLPAEGFAANFRIETWSRWILSVVSAPTLRAIDFGIGLGGLAMGLRIWLGIERGALFGD